MLRRTLKRTEPSDRTSGFTLVELLVVIAVLGILMAMLIPSITSVKEKSFMLRCKQNLGSLAQASLAYATVNRGQLPWAGEWVGSSAASSPHWSVEVNVTTGKLWQYLSKEPRTYVCDKFVRTYKLNPAFSSINRVHCSYVMNAYFSEGGFLEKEVFKGLRSQVLFPVRLGLFSEENAFTRLEGEESRYTTEVIEDLRLAPGNFGTQMTAKDGEAIASFHDAPAANLLEGYANVVFVDGHVDRRHPRETKEIMTPELVKRKIDPGRAPKP